MEQAQKHSWMAARRWLLLVLLALAWPSAARAQATARADAQYVASSRGQAYYWIGCSGWKRLSPGNLRYFQNAAAAETAGYRPSQARGCAPHRDTALIQPTAGGSALCTVSRIVDGDTFVCEGGSRVRMLLIDTDERGQSVYADSALALLTRLAPPGSHVRLEFDIEHYDRYDRVLGYVYNDSVFVNREIARAGLAHVAIYPPNVRMVDVIRAAVDSAQAQRRGIWSGSAFECAPQDYRARRCR